MSARIDGLDDYVLCGRIIFASSSMLRSGSEVIYLKELQLNMLSECFYVLNVLPNELSKCF